jgi:hypothetical protein
MALSIRFTLIFQRDLPVFYYLGDGVTRTDLLVLGSRHRNSKSRVKVINAASCHLQFSHPTVLHSMSAFRLKIHWYRRLL